MRNCPPVTNICFRLIPTFLASLMFNVRVNQRKVRATQNVCLVQEKYEALSFCRSIIFLLCSVFVSRVSQHLASCKEKKNTLFLTSQPLGHHVPCVLSQSGQRREVCYACLDLRKPFLDLSFARELSAVPRDISRCMSEEFKPLADKNLMTEFFLPWSMPA